MYDEDLKYIAISYRWGEVGEQLIETPDYTTHVTSFGICDLVCLCGSMYYDEDLNEIPYLWIDAISVDQQDHSRKKKTILQMSEIYKRASYILAVPDLHYRYLMTNPENEDVLGLMIKYKARIDSDIRKIINQADDDSDYGDDNEDNGDIKEIYRFLAYLVQDWANRAWVISEYQIAKEKKEKYGTPMKYIFISLAGYTATLFFAYSFDHHDININNNNNRNHNNISYFEVDTGRKFIKFLKKILTQRSYLEMLLNSKASRNEDRFNAILPSWKEYRHVIKNKNTISNWQITDMTSVRLKLYEIMDDLWDKARLLYACSCYVLFGFPTFARHHHTMYVYLKEIDGTDALFDPDGEYYSVKIQKGFTTGISLNNESDNAIDHSTKDKFISYDVPYEIKNERMQIDRTAKIKQFTKNVIPYDIISAQMGDANLIDIQLNNHGKYGHPYLSVKSKFCFYYIVDMEVINSLKSEYSLKDTDSFICVRIPFFIPGRAKFDGSINDISDIYLIGYVDENIWKIYRSESVFKDMEWTFVFVDDYIFNVY